MLRDSVLKVVEGSKEEPQVDVQPPKRQRGARTKPKMDVEAQQQQPSPEFRDVASFTSFFGERCTVHAAPLRRVLGSWSAARFLYANLATIRREAVALAAQRARVLAAERRGGDKPALVEFDLNHGTSPTAPTAASPSPTATSSTRRRNGPSSFSRPRRARFCCTASAPPPLAC